MNHIMKPRHILPLLSVLLLFSCAVLAPEARGATAYHQKAFLPACWCTSVDISPDRSTIYARALFAEWDEGVRLYNGATYQHIKDIEDLPSVPWTILASADGNYLYASYYYGGSVVKLDASTGEVAKSISVGPWPAWMIFDSGRRYLYVGVNCPGTGAVGSISVIDTSSDTVVGGVSLNGEPNHCLVLSPDDQFLYVGTHQRSPERLFKIRVSDRSVVKTLDMPGLHNPAMSGSPDGNFLYLADVAGGVVRIIETGSLTQTGTYSIPHVQNFSVAPSGDHGLAVSYTPGSSEVFIHVFDMPTATVVQTLQRTLTGSTENAYAGVCPIIWDEETGRAYIVMEAWEGGVIVLSPVGEAWQVVYQTDFSTDPGWVTDQPTNYYWNQTAWTYHARVENNAPAYRPNRYFYTPVTWTGDSFEIQWDIKMTRVDWSAGVSFGLFDENIAFAGFNGGQGVCLEFANPDAGRLLWLYICGGGGLASASSPGGTYAVNTLYTCKISYDAGARQIKAELLVHGTGASVWSKTLSVPGGFTQPLTKLGGSRCGFGEVGGYSGVDRWGVAEAEIDNVVLRRAGIGPQPPAVTQFAINNGAETTESRTVSLNNTATNNPTHCMASEDSGFAAATWEVYSTAPQFTLSEGDGQKTVYFKAKNATGESNVVSDTIDLIAILPGPEITTTSLPGGVEGHPYSQALQVSGGVAPYTWSIATGKLPDGLTLNPNTGVISGTPTNAAVGTSTFTVRVADSQSKGDTIYVFGGIHDAYSPLSSMEKHDPVADAWTFVSPMNEARYLPGFCTDDEGRFYAIAGQSENVLRSVERYDPARDKWEYLAPLPIAVGAPAAFAFDGEIYAVGGWMPGYTNRCFIYSPETDTWREGPPMYESLGHGAPVVSLSGLPYLIGGHLDQPSWSIRSAVSVLVREDAELVWKPSTPLQRRRTGAGVTLGLDGLIYAIGGDQEPGSSGHLTTETVERFSEATKVWEYVEPMPTKRAFAGAVTGSSGRIWVVGGTDWTSPTFFDSAVCYDPGTGSWTTMTSRLNTGRACHGIAILRGEGRTDEQELSITVLPRGTWRIGYEADFSSDPHWITDDPANLFWNAQAQVFDGWQSNTPASYAYVPVSVSTDVLFRLEFDVKIDIVEWSAGVTFGLFDQRLMYNAGIVVDYSLWDAGFVTALYAGNPSGPPDWEVTNWQPGIWYHNVLEYDPATQTIRLEVRRKDDGTLLCELSLGNIRSLPPGMSLLGVSRLHMEGYNDSAVDFSLDNITLKQLRQPPKHPVEILRLPGPLLRISWDSEPGAEYQLWATSDLTSGEWIPVGPRMGGTGAKLYVDDYVEGAGCRFYRIEIISPVAKSPDYAVVASESTASADGWKDVINAAVSRHSAQVIAYSGTPFPASVKEELAACRPRYVCFVAQAAEVTEDFVRNAHQLTRELDEDPFGDCLWGIVTGQRADDALGLVTAQSPFQIEKALLKSAGDFLEWLPAGEYHSEGNNQTMWVKEEGGEIDKRTDGPYDDTETLVVGLNSGQYQLFLTSGHASQYTWQLHWPDPDGEGFFYSDDGQLYAIDHNGTRFDINNPQPIVYWGPGNCLIGRLAGPDSIALGWLGSGGAIQFCGYVIPTWYGYMGWGLNDYFLKLQDRFSFAEAFFLTNQALIFDQIKSTPGTNPYGLEYDKNTVVFYGNPAVRAVVSPCRAPLYDQTLSFMEIPGDGRYRISLTITMGEEAEVPRPVIAFLPFRIEPAETVIEVDESSALEITDDLILAQIWTEENPPLPKGRQVNVVFSCRKAA